MRSRGTKRAVSCVCLTLVLGALLTVCAISGCKNTPENHKILSFFFDGVPDPNEGESSESEAGTAADAAQLVSRPKPSLHKPVQEKRCETCHDESQFAARARGFSGVDIRTIERAWNSCNTCHSDPSEVDERSLVVRRDQWLHGPVAAGRCRDCHHGHRSKLPHLLRSESLEAACRSCHEQLSERSGSMAELACVECHDPHSAARNSDLLLRGGLAGNCLRCHTLATETRPWLHGPVANGVCRACHSGHGGTGYVNHTREPIRDACLHCHQTADLCDDGKAPAEGDSCVQCHDPHSATSASDWFLRDRIQQNGGAESAFVPAGNPSPAGQTSPPPASTVSSD